MSVKVVHIINSLEYGGAEAMLCNLLARSDRERFDPTAVLLIDDLTLADRLDAIGVPIRVVGMRPGIPDPRGVARLAGILRRERPGLVQTWMDHSNLIGGVAARLAVRAPVVWGVHHSDHVRGLTKRTTLLTVSACARLSRRLPAAVVFCSEHARAMYAQKGFAAEKTVVIPNGFDTEVFRPDSSARRDVRRELGLAPDATLIGLVARYDRVKDHANFVRAAALLKDEAPDVHYVMCGDRVDLQNPALAAAVAASGLGDRCHLLGPRRDVARIHASLDIATSSSISEAFPLAVGEAMASGVPCVVTDVGDSALIVGPTGQVVPPRDSSALAQGWRSLLAIGRDDRERLGRDARQRILDRYDLSAVTRQYEELHEALIDRRGPSGASLAEAGRAVFFS